MHSCDVLVIDLSKTKAGTGWEFDQLRLRSLHSRCLFVAGDLADVKAVFDAHFADEEPPLVHLYGKTGKLADPRSFEEHIQSIIEPAIAGWNHGLPQPAPPSLLT